ncbi:N,N'-diacetylchitobiose phosphorylase [candidate division KSB1 bacterium]|nr:N,N'-diacetylchitobiose phosphorylase [candidate division KSB1 bacterium]
MQYGYFDNKNHEYVITRPDTPRSWTNYLGDTRYGAVITNNGGGYSFFLSAAQGRFTRLRSNDIPVDQPGRYLFLRDQANGDYWSTTWQPVGKPLTAYQTECRHGTAYTKISSKYSKIQTETTYFVPLGRDFECWWLKVTNQDSQPRQLRLFSFIEYSNHWVLWMDYINLQYTQYIMQMEVVDDIIDHGTNVYIPAEPFDFENHGQARHTFMGLVGAPVTGFETDRDLFLGPYRSYGNPLMVEQGRCTNSLAASDNSCGVLQTDLTLQPGQTTELCILMGIGKAATAGKQVIQEFSDLSKVNDEFEKLKQHWHSRLNNFTVKTPDTEFDSMFNTWNPYNCLLTYAWSRAASLIYAGERDGLGYRDSVQDLLGVLPIIPDEAQARLELLLTGQVSTGGAMPVVKPFSHHPGQEKPPKATEYRSDDCLWLFNTVPAYVKETGNIAFFDKPLPYADAGEATVLGHLKQAIQFSLDRSGAHGLPCGLLADWNDCLQLGQQGESVFVAFQLRYALKTYLEICEMLHRPEEINWAQTHLAQLDQNLNNHAWDGNWFLRAFRHDGFKFGSHESDEGSIFLNPQTWAIFSGHATPEQAQQILKAIHERLATDFGLMICDPPYEKTDINVVKATLFNKGTKENAGIFCHTQGWAIIAEAMLGHGNQAYEYCRAFLPAAYNTRAEVRQIEPYVYCQSTHSKYSRRYGASRIPWLSGTATWAYYAFSQYILGIQPEYHGLRVDPCIPANWKKVEVERIFRNQRFHILIRNPNQVQKGVKEIIFNQVKLEGILIPLEQMQPENWVDVLMG